MSESTGEIGRRVVLRGALATSAVLAAGCATSITAVETGTTTTRLPPPGSTTSSPPPSQPVPAPTTTPPSTTIVPAVETVPDFGAMALVGVVDELRDVEAGHKLFVPETRAYLVRYPDEHIDAAKLVYELPLHAGLDAGFLALYQKCTHLGCRVPECAPSGQFECPCHGSIYTAYGEKLGGPAPRGLDLFAIDIRDDELFIDLNAIFQGQPIGTDVTAWEPQGPGCMPFDPVDADPLVEPPDTE